MLWEFGGHAPTKALFASALTLAASCLASSDTSCKVSELKAGDGGLEVAGVERPAEERSDESLMVVGYRVFGATAAMINACFLS